MKYFVTHFIINANNEDVKQVARELTADMVAECGYETFVDTENGTDGYIQIDFYDEQFLISLISEFPISGVSIDFTTEEVVDQDWNETWESEEGFEPIHIGGKVLVYDVHHYDLASLDDAVEEVKIGIQARNAFGTGTHETTRMMINSLINLDMKGKRVLDCGCGTGILSIAALKCGADAAVGYDIDEWSVENTMHNAKLNGVDNHIQVFEGDSNVLSHVCGVFDVVMANINRNILLADMSVFNDLMSADGQLLISGFYETDVPVLVDKAESIGLSVTSKVLGGEWCHLIFVRQ